MLAQQGFGREGIVLDQPHALYALLIVALRQAHLTQLPEVFAAQARTSAAGTLQHQPFAAQRAQRNALAVEQLQFARHAGLIHQRHDIDQLTVIHALCGRRKVIQRQRSDKRRQTHCQHQPECEIGACANGLGCAHGAVCLVVIELSGVRCRLSPSQANKVSKAMTYHCNA